jgi:hypothetical protein
LCVCCRFSGGREEASGLCCVDPNGYAGLLFFVFSAFFWKDMKWF